MKCVNVYEAKTRLSQLLGAVERGEEFVIARNGTPIARLVPLHPPSRRGLLGVDAGTVVLPEDLHLSDPDVLESFEKSVLSPR